MKYKELMAFEPIETVIQLTDANNNKQARNLVQSYVVSGTMADRLTSLVFPQIQFEQPQDNKGLLIIGNYGTGKSHLMSFISAIAEKSEMLEDIKYKTIFSTIGDEKKDENRFYADEIAGKFKVLRIEIGSTEAPLREIIVHELENYLESIGIHFKFPSIQEITNNKIAIEDMMNSFQKEFPDKGLMIIVDELLDYLKTRKDQAIALDLNFIRELGEASKNLRFRFIAGIQEALFDNPRFAFVAETIRWVLARYEQVYIQKSDIEFVVKERLLSKTANQENEIRKHLLKFTTYYENMNERMHEFVKMFPVHPDFVDTFERVTMIEKREILKTISKQMRNLLEKDIPQDHPGLIAFDSYWEEINNNASLKTQPDVKEVMDCSNVIVDQVENAFTKPQYKDMAIHVVKGLAIHRLTTGDTRSPIGMTAGQLQNKLCLYHPMIKELGSNEPDKDLHTLVKTVLDEIMKTMNGQFITRNKENEQYFINLDLVENYDARIDDRAKVLSNDIVDRYYYIALRQAMECPDTTYIKDFKIWEYELDWQEKNTGRSGYLFFGSPNQRSTVVPPRDFYIYFIQPFEPPNYKDDKKEDEVFVTLRNFDENFTEPLRLLAASRELFSTASGNAKRIYENKAQQYLHECIYWMQEHIFEAFNITYQGNTKILESWLQTNAFQRFQMTKAQGAINLKEIMDSVTGGCLSTHFNDLAPDYPKFSIMIRKNNREQTAEAAIRQIAGLRETQQGTAILDALELMDGPQIITEKSRYANTIKSLLAKKPEGQVCNHNEILIYENGLSYMDPDGQRLEPVWVIVVMAAMVYAGDIILSIPGKKFDATNLRDLAATPMEILRQFKHIERPKEWNLTGLKALFELFDLPPGTVNALIQGNHEAVQNLQIRIKQTLDNTIMAKQILRSGLLFWKTPIYEERIEREQISKIDELKEFLDSLGRYNTIGKLKNFTMTSDEIQRYQKNLKQTENIKMMKEILNDLSDLVNWLIHAIAYRPYQEPWVKRVYQLKQDALEALRKTKVEELREVLNAYRRDMETLKEEYINEYFAHHQKARLNVVNDQMKAKLINDKRFRTLDQLTEIELLPKQELISIKKMLGELKSCFSLRKTELEKTPICPHCNFKPNEPNAEIAAEQRLSHIDREMDNLITHWKQTMLENLSDPNIAADLNLLTEDERTIILKFQKSEELPFPVTKTFIDAIQEVFSGLEKIKINMSQVMEALRGSSGAATQQEIKLRFNNYIDQLMKGKDHKKVRFVIEKDHNEEN
ncbi:MAG: ATP-binding protein [Tissierellales bacterium]|nr:ATP-binding protein [Tissierellales bacterium]